MKRLPLIVLVAILATSAHALRAQQSGNDLFQKALSKERVDGQLEQAIEIYERVVKDFASDRALTARALLQLGRCYDRLGKADARKTYERLVRDYADQRGAASEARGRLAELDRAASAGAGGMTARRVWAGRDVVVEGAPSADGRYLSTIDRATGDLAIRDLTTGQMRRLFAKRAGAQGPEFAEASIPSPDGTRIVYQWFTDQSSYELRTIGLTDAEPRVLYSQPDNYVSPAGWSADGKHVLAVTGHNRASQLVWLSVADRSVRVLKTLDWRWPIGVRLSPDGRFIVYDFPPHEEHRQRDIFLLHADGSRETRLVEHAANDVQPIWTPDGKGVLFTSDRTGVNSLWMIRVSDGKPQGTPAVVRPDVGQSFPMGFTRSGTYYYGSHSGGVDVYLASLDRVNGKPTSVPAPLTDRFVGANRSPEWSPDGTSLVYIAQRGPAFGGSVDAGHLVVRSVETREQRDLSTALRRFFRPRWAPDGRLSVAATDPKGSMGWYRIDVATGAYERLRLAEQDASIDELEWSADGRAVFYHARDAAGSRLMRQPLDGQEPQELYRAPAAAMVRALTVSPDGRHLAFRATDPKSHLVVLNVLPATGGDAAELVRLGKDEIIPGSFVAGPITWTPASDAVLFIKRTKTGHDEARSEVWRVSLAARSAEPLGVSMTGLGHIRMRPDGGALALAAGDTRAEVWVMENFLPAPTAKATTAATRGARR